jgi:hypothetical protein
MHLGITVTNAIFFMKWEGWGYDSLVKYMLNIHGALALNPSTKKRRKKLLRK